MSKKTQRKKPGYTRSGEVKIVSLNGPQLVALLDKTTKPKKRSQIQRRIRDLGFVAPVVEPVTE
jgi:hypothetical protein